MSRREYSFPCCFLVRFLVCEYVNLFVRLFVLFLGFCPVFFSI